MNGFHYEGWAIIGGAPVSTGKFNVDSNGGLVTTSGASIPGNTFSTGVDLSTATAIILTIEPAGDADAVPADTHIAAGSVSNQSATLSVGDGAALGSDFASAVGDYILATPTNGADNDENSGIWFLSLASGAPAVGLTLPTLPAGWQYEGWVVMGGMPVTSGTFTAVISIEPDPDDASTPFTLKPLVGMIPADAVDHTTYSLGSNLGSLPTGTAIIR